MFHKRYKIGKKIGKGSFGEVYKGIDIITNQQIAIKIEPIVKDKFSILQEEIKIYEKIQKCYHVPQVIWHGQTDTNRILVMDLYGASLENLKRKQFTFTVPYVCKIAIQILQSLQQVHNRNVLHRDLKPDNILIGSKKNNDHFYLVDFGLSKKFIRNGNHLEYREDKSFVGTLRYSSVKSHIGIQQSRRDDLESFGYVLIYLLQSDLPWTTGSSKEKEQKYKHIKLTKIVASLQELCKGIPVEFYQYLCYCKNLDFEETPHYEYLIQLFENLLSSYDSTN